MPGNEPKGSPDVVPKRAWQLLSRLPQVSLLLLVVGLSVPSYHCVPVTLPLVVAPDVISIVKLLALAVAST
jgi:hypothetical protein